MIGVNLHTGAIVRAQNVLQGSLARSMRERPGPPDDDTDRRPARASGDRIDSEEADPGQARGTAGDEAPGLPGSARPSSAGANATWETPEISAFDVVVMLATSANESLDPTHPEAVAIASHPRMENQLRRRHIRRHLAGLVAPERGPLLGFRGPSTPYWSLTGSHPSVALVELRHDVQLFRQAGENYPRVRFQWGRSEERLPLLDPTPARAMDLHERTNPGKMLIEEVLGFQPAYLVACITPPIEGYSYKVAVALLPKP